MLCGSSSTWTAEETNLFCETLSDSISNFILTLEKKALKKASTKEVIIEILAELLERFSEETFKSRNTHSFTSK